MADLASLVVAGLALALSIGCAVSVRRSAPIALREALDDLAARVQTAEGSQDAVQNAVVKLGRETGEHLEHFENRITAAKTDLATMMESVADRVESLEHIRRKLAARDSREKNGGGQGAQHQVDPADLTQEDVRQLARQGGADVL